MPATAPTPSELENSLLRDIVDHISAMVAYWDRDQRCRFANRAYQDWFGVDPAAMVGRDMREFLGPLYQLNRPYIEAALRGEPQEFERDIPNPHGGPPRRSLAQYIPDVVNGEVRGFCVLVTDVSRLKAAEEAITRMELQLQSTEHLVSLGRMAGGIAHEVNNPLAVVIGNLELALDQLDTSPGDCEEVGSCLRDALSSAQRLSGLMQSMKLLARSEAALPELIDVNRVLEQSLRFASVSLRYQAQLRCDFGEGCHVRGSSSQLAQLFVNLIVKAGQSVTSVPDLAAEIRLSSSRRAGQVVVEIEDNGPAASEPGVIRAFEPFLASTASEKADLGMSIAAAIARGLGGELARERTADVNRFRVVLPAAASDRQHGQAQPPSGDGAHPIDRDGDHAPALRPHLLVIDDEIAVANMLSRLLSRDCEVSAITSPRMALEELTRDLKTPAPDLILCDLMMPDMSGEELFRRVTAVRPELADRFVFMTGGAFTPEGRQFLASIAAPVVDKPFDIVVLRALIRARCRGAQSSFGRRSS